jgi:methyl-coenzyme M reductase subunit D
MGPGTGMNVDHPERKMINVKGKETELWVQVGRIFVEVDDIDNVQYVTEKVEAICEGLLPFGFTLEIGRYSKFKPTVTDYAKGRC